MSKHTELTDQDHMPMNCQICRTMHLCQMYSNIVATRTHAKTSEILDNYCIAFILSCDISLTNMKRLIKTQFQILVRHL